MKIGSPVRNALSLYWEGPFISASLFYTTLGMYREGVSCGITTAKNCNEVEVDCAVNMSRLILLYAETRSQYAWSEHMASLIRRFFPSRFCLEGDRFYPSFTYPENTPPIYILLIGKDYCNWLPTIGMFDCCVPSTSRHDLVVDQVSRVLGDRPWRDFEGMSLYIVPGGHSYSYGTPDKVLPKFPMPTEFDLEKAWLSVRPKKKKLLVLPSERLSYLSISDWCRESSSIISFGKKKNYLSGVVVDCSSGYYDRIAKAMATLENVGINLPLYTSSYSCEVPCPYPSVNLEEVPTEEAWTSTHSFFLFLKGHQKKVNLGSLSVSKKGSTI